MPSPIPVILCGAKKEVASMVKAGLLPEYDVVYAGYNIALSKNEVPLIISGQSPAPSSLHTQISSNDFTDPPRAIITGGGYNDEIFQELYQACVEACGSNEDLVPFLRASNEITDRLAAEGKGPAHSSPQYPKAVAERIKEKLREVGIAPGVQESADESKGKILFF